MYKEINLQLIQRNKNMSLSYHVLGQCGIEGGFKVDHGDRSYFTNVIGYSYYVTE